jgi:flagellar assembly protein FliH
MQWSKNYLTREDTENQVLEFVPQKFDMGTPNQAQDYLKAIQQGSDFRMSDVSRVQTGVDKIEKISEEEKIEVRALEKLKEIQEAAYREAYALGLDDGRKKAFQEFSSQIEFHLQRLSNLIQTMTTIKEHMLAFNEAHLVKLMYHMASRLTFQNLENNNPVIIEVIKSSVILAQDEENITIRVSPEQYEFLETLKKEHSQEYDFLAKVKLEASADIKSGGCVVETNYGEVDARIEQRINQLWEGIVDHIPKVKDKLEGNE